MMTELQMLSDVLQVAFLQPLPQPRAPRYAALDVWRGVACLLIVVFHSIWYTPYYQAFEAHQAFVPGPGVANKLAYALQWLCGHLWIGVPAFFVISGYCISATMDSQRRKEHGLIEYFRRRMRRIYPPYWIALASVGVIMLVSEQWLSPGLFGDEPRLAGFPNMMHPDQWLGNMTLTESWRYLVFGNGQSYVLGVSWTLCYEEQFYALAGLILLLCPRRMFAGAMLLSVLSISLRIAAGIAGVPVKGFFFDGHWMQFAAGIMAYYTINYASAMRRRWTHVGLFALLTAGLIFKKSLPADVDRNTIVAFGFAWLLLLLHRYDGGWSRARVLGPLRYCGRICYSLYLTHWIVAKPVSHLLYSYGLQSAWATLTVTVPICVALSLAVSALFYVLIERHFLNMQSKQQAASSPPVLVQVPALSLG